MAKKGMSGDMVLQIGLLAIAAFTTLMAVNLFYDSVEVSVFGNPYLAAKTMASYTDFIDSSPLPMKIYHEIPQDFMGNPGYGTVLYNPQTCEFRVNKYPQDYMSDVILNHAWDTVTLEEALSIYALSKWSKSLSTQLLRAGAHVAADNSLIKNRIKTKLMQDELKKQGIKPKDLVNAYNTENKAAIEAGQKRKLRPTDLDNMDDLKRASRAHQRAAAPASKELAEKEFAAFWKGVDQSAADDAAKRAPGLFSKAKQGVIAGAVASKNFIGAKILYVTSPVRSAYTTVKKTVSSSMKQAMNRFKTRIINPVLRGLGISTFLKATQDTAPPISTAIATVLSLASYGLESWLTYLPINHFIDRSQDATEAINNEWSSVSCLSKPEKVVVSKPNCESEPFAVYPDLTSWLDNDRKWLGLINLFSTLESALAMPKSRPINEIKNYPNVENGGKVCVDTHNYLLSDEVDIVGDKYVNPKHVILTVPFATCGAVSLLRPSWGPACTGTYALTYLSMWATPKDTVESVKLAGVLSAASLFISGNSPAALVIVNLPNLIGIDSTNFFPYISKSAGMVDTENYYYIENPYMISISKDYKDGEYVTEINKEL